MGGIGTEQGEKREAGLWIVREHWEQMRAHVKAQTPLEACGLVAGRFNCSQAVFKIANMLQSPVRFRMEPGQQVEALLQIEENGWDLLAIYHSHPNGPPAPSPTDLNEATFPEAIALIWSRHGRHGRMVGMAMLGIAAGSYSRKGGIVRYR